MPNFAIAVNHPEIVWVGVYSRLKEIEAEIALGCATIFDIVGGGAVRTGGGVLHLPEGCGRDTEPIVDLPVEINLRAAVERSERRAALQREDIGKIRRHRMPGLSDFPHAAVTGDRDECLAQTQLGRARAAVQSGIEVRLDFPADFVLSGDEILEIQAETGGKGREAE